MYSDHALDVTDVAEAEKVASTLSACRPRRSSAARQAQWETGACRVTPSQHAATIRYAPSPTVRNSYGAGPPLACSKAYNSHISTVFEFAIRHVRSWK